MKKQRQLLATLLAGAMLASVVTGCGSKEEPAPAETPAEAPEETPAEAPEEAEAPESISYYTIFFCFFKQKLCTFLSFFVIILTCLIFNRQCKCKKGEHPT